MSENKGDIIPILAILSIVVPLLTAQAALAEMKVKNV
jgi:hypothetical protein